MSRLLNETAEWKLDPSIFHKILKLFSVEPEIDNLLPIQIIRSQLIYHGILVRIHMQLMQLAYHGKIQNSTLFFHLA